MIFEKKNKVKKYSGKEFLETPGLDNIIRT